MVIVFRKDYESNFQLVLIREKLMIPYNSLLSYFNYLIIHNQLSVSLDSSFLPFIRNQLEYYYEQLQQNLYLIYNLD